MFLLISKQLYWAAHTKHIFDPPWVARDSIISVFRGIKWGSSGIMVGLSWKVLILSYYSTSIPDSQLSEAKMGGLRWHRQWNQWNGNEFKSLVNVTLFQTNLKGVKQVWLLLSWFTEMFSQLQRELSGHESSGPPRDKEQTVTKGRYTTDPALVVPSELTLGVLRGKRQHHWLPSNSHFTTHFIHVRGHRGEYYYYFPNAEQLGLTEVKRTFWVWL